MRCFVALALPADVRAALAAAIERVRRQASRADVRWAAGDAMHLTLRFLGEVADARVEQVGQAVCAGAARHAPMALRAAGLGSFPGGTRPRVVWAGIDEGVEPLAALAADLEAAAVGLGFPPEGRPFRAHVTLGRVRTPRGAGALGAALRDATPEVFGAWTAHEVILYRSHLHPAGARYEALARCPLGAAAARQG